MPRSRAYGTPVRYADAPTVLDRPTLISCPDCLGERGRECGICFGNGFIQCAHPLADLGDSYAMGDDVATIAFAKCSICRSDVRDPREDAGQDRIDSLHTRNGDDAIAPESFQSRGRD